MIYLSIAQKTQVEGDGVTGFGTSDGRNPRLPADDSIEIRSHALPVADAVFP